MIKVQKLSKHYGPLRALNDISFEVGAGEVLGLLGPNGAGKTTTIRLLTTFLPPTSGTAEIAGFDISKQADEVRKNIGYLPEVAPLYPELRVNEYLNFIGNLRGLSGRALKDATDKVITRCALEPVMTRLCSQLSKGFRQRVGLAQAIIHEPKVIILDEPTSGLDPTQIREIRALIAELRKGCTLILSTHILQEVIENCSRVLILAAGQVACEGTLAELTGGTTLEARYLQAVGAERSAT